MTANSAPGSKRHLISDPLQLTADEMRMLLDDLDQRLRDRDIAASVYVVGGAALALTGDRDQLTPDIDAITTEKAVWEEAIKMADQYGLPTTWINSGAKPFVPPRPTESLLRPTRPGLTIHFPPPEHLLAMKAIALRPKDRPDIERLVTDLGMEDASAKDFADLLERVYGGEDRLADALGVPGSDPEQARVEATYLGQAVARIAQQAKARRHKR